MKRVRLLLAAGSVATVLGAVVPAAAGTFTMSGRVTDLGGNPIADACVWIYDDDGARRQAVTPTGADGTYSVNGSSTASGGFRVLFQDCKLIIGQKRFVSEWWQNQPTFAAATRLALDDPHKDFTGIDATVSPGGRILGSVRDANAATIAGICVEVTPAEPGPVFGRAEFPARAKTDTGGAYTVGVLPTGKYVVAFKDCSTQPVYFDTTYGSQVSVVDGADTTGIDVTMPAGAVIRGTVRDIAGNPLATICVAALTPTGTTVESDLSDQTGAFDLRPLGAGTYVVGFTDCANRGYDQEFYDDAISLDQATPIAVTAGQLVTGIDAAPTLCARSPDADFDGLTACDEQAHGTDPTNPDTDYDRLLDGEEVNLYDTNPTRLDTDGDAFGDGFEVQGGECLTLTLEGGSDPNDPTSTPLPPPFNERPGPALPIALPVLCR